MTDATITKLTSLFTQFAVKELSINVSTTLIESALRDALFTSRKLWQALEAQLITIPELAGALTAHAQRAILDYAGLVRQEGFEAKWDDLVYEVEKAIIVGMQSRPR